MAFLGFLGKNEHSSAVKNAVKEALKKQGIVDQLSIINLDRAKADVAKWRDALSDWENTTSPDRYDMMQLYAEIIQDDSVATHINTILRSIDATSFEVGKLSNGKYEMDEERTNLLLGDWFQKIVKYVIEAELMGFTLVEVMKPETGENYDADDIQLIPREFVIPEWNKVRKKPQQNNDLIDFSLPEFSDRLLKIGDKRDKGLLNNLALAYIYKKNALAFWGNYQSKFGIPPMVVKTDLTDERKVNTLVNFMQEMRNNSFTVTGQDDVIEALKGVDSDVYETFLKLVEHCDAQIAKVLEGQTMTSNNGSSRSQAEVHERVANNWHIARLRMVERVVNTQLLPILTADGFSMDGYVFYFNEVKDVDSIIERALSLKQAGYQVDVEYLSELTGLPLEIIQATPAQTQTPPNNDSAKSMVETIHSLYNGMK